MEENKNSSGKATVSHCLPRAKLMMMMRIRAQLESGPICLICDFIAMKFILVFFLLFLFPFALFTFAPKPVSVSLCFQQEFSLPFSTSHSSHLFFQLRLLCCLSFLSSFHFTRTGTRHAVRGRQLPPLNVYFYVTHTRHA